MALISYLTTIRFGCGVLSEISEDLDALSIRRPLIVTDKGVIAAGLVERLFAVMPTGVPRLILDDVPSNPTEEAAHAALSLYRDNICDGVIGLGEARRSTSLKPSLSWQPIPNRSRDTP